MREIHLTKGYVTLIDDEDYALVAHIRWRALEAWRRDGTKRVYAVSAVKPTLFLHREILRVQGGRAVPVDHIDGDGLNNRRLNLRVCTTRSNLQNQRPRAGKFKGITRRRGDGRYQATITIAPYRKLSLGCFGTPEEAALAWDEAARLYHGEFARLNFPEVLHALNVEHGEAKCPSTEPQEEFFA